MDFQVVRLLKGSFFLTVFMIECVTLSCWNTSFYSKVKRECDSVVVTSMVKLILK